MLPSPTRRKNGVEHAMTAVQFLAEIVDVAGVAFPPVQAAARIALKIVDAAQRVKSNQDDCMTIADRCSDLVTVIDQATSDQAVTDRDIDPRLQKDVQRVIMTLESIHATMTAQASRSVFQRVVHYMTDAGRINKCNVMLDDCYRTFQMCSSIATRIQLHRLESTRSQSPPIIAPTTQSQSPPIIPPTTQSPSPPIIPSTTQSQSPPIIPPTTPDRTRVYLKHGPNPRSSFRNMSPHPVTYKHKLHPTAMHLLYALKFPPDIGEMIRTCGDSTDTATDIERCHAKAIRKDWKRVRIQVCDQVLRHKFRQHPTLRQDLLDTGDAEIINDTTNSFWGLGDHGRGANEHGKALMRLRDKFRQELIM